MLAGSLPGSGHRQRDRRPDQRQHGLQLSSVDNANTETGQILVAQALNFLLAGKKPAAYGVASGVVPSPAPTASPTATPAKTKSTR